MLSIQENSEKLEIIDCIELASSIQSSNQNKDLFIFLAGVTYAKNKMTKKELGDFIQQLLQYSLYEQNKIIAEQNFYFLLNYQIQEPIKFMKEQSLKYTQQICQICFLQEDSGQLTYFLSCCNQKFHKQCLLECFDAQESQNLSNIKCPNFDCLKDISQTDIQTIKEFNNSQQLSFIQSEVYIPRMSLRLRYEVQDQKEVKDEQKIESSSLVKDKIQNCEICFEEMSENSLQTLNCQHKYHKECLEQYFNFETSQKRFPLKCPKQDCLIEIQQSVVKETLNQQDFEKYENFQLYNYIDMNSSETKWCLTPDCKYAFISDIGFIKFSCPICDNDYCIACQSDWHFNQTCQEYQNQKDSMIRGLDKQFEDLATDKKFKKCTSCKMWIEKNQGCVHMTCRCGYEFCYECGGPYNACNCMSSNQIFLQQAPIIVNQPNQFLEQNNRNNNQINSQEFVLNNQQPNQSISYNLNNGQFLNNQSLSVQQSPFQLQESISFNDQINNPNQNSYQQINSNQQLVSQNLNTEAPSFPNLPKENINSNFQNNSFSLYQNSKQDQSLPQNLNNGQFLYQSLSVYQPPFQLQESISFNYQTNNPNQNSYQQNQVENSNIEVPLFPNLLKRKIDSNFQNNSFNPLQNLEQNQSIPSNLNNGQFQRKQSLLVQQSPFQLEDSTSLNYSFNNPNQNSYQQNNQNQFQVSQNLDTETALFPNLLKENINSNFQNNSFSPYQNSKQNLKSNNQQLPKSSSSNFYNHTEPTNQFRDNQNFNPSSNNNNSQNFNRFNVNSQQQSQKFGNQLRGNYNNYQSNNTNQPQMTNLNSQNQKQALKFQNTSNQSDQFAQFEYQDSLNMISPIKISNNLNRFKKQDELNITFQNNQNQQSFQNIQQYLEKYPPYHQRNTRSNQNDQQIQRNPRNKLSLNDQFVSSTSNYQNKIVSQSTKNQIRGNQFPQSNYNQHYLNNNDNSTQKSFQFEIPQKQQITLLRKYPENYSNSTENQNQLNFAQKNQILTPINRAQSPIISSQVRSSTSLQTLRKIEPKQQQQINYTQRSSRQEFFLTTINENNQQNYD